MTKAEKKALAESLIAETRRIGDMVKDITPAGGHLSLTWFPETEHVDVVIYDGLKSWVLDAWQCTRESPVNFSHE